MTPRPSPEPTGSPLHPQLALADAKARPSVQLASRTLDWCLLCSALAGLVSSIWLGICQPEACAADSSLSTLAPILRSPPATGHQPQPGAAHDGDAVIQIHRSIDQ